MRDKVSADVLSRIRLTCLDLPEVVEEKAWAGVRWCVSKKNVAHVLLINAGWPPAYWDELDELFRDSYRVRAPKKLLARMLE